MSESVGAARARIAASWRRRRRSAAVPVLALLAALTLAACVADGTPRRPAETSASALSLEEAGARAAHTATTLADGRILIAGGCVVDGCSTATATTVVVAGDGAGAASGADMAVARTSHTATGLSDGRVVLTGGFPGENAGVTDSVDVFDPGTGTMSALPGLAIARGGHAAAPLPDGRVLVVGGWVAPRSYTAEVEVVDPMAGTTTGVAPLPWAADALEATPLADGRVLVTGGQVAPGRATARAAVFDPATARWIVVGGMTTPRLKHVAVALADGRVLVAGGTSDDEVLLATTELFDPADGMFQPGPALLEPRYKLPGGALSIDDTHVLFAAGGRTAELLDIATGTSVTVADLGGRASFATVNRLRDGRALVLGGYDERIAVHPRVVFIASATAGDGGISRGRNSR